MRLATERPTSGRLPTQVRNLSNITQVVTGRFHACALKSDRTVWCWGEGTYGALGNGGADDQSTPVRVIGLTNVRRFCARYGNLCSKDRRERLVLGAQRLHATRGWVDQDSQRRCERRQ